LAKKVGIKVKITPRLGVGKSREFEGPRKIIAYQMMGKNLDGNLCPFLQIHSSENSPHGAFKCKIYEKRPLACRIYPVLDECKKRAILDGKCRFCCKFATTNSDRSNLYEEIRALNIIKETSQRKNARFGDMQRQSVKRSIKQNFWPRVDS
jgi:Fe-S-cluster containining protein